ncbi:pyruvate kinase, partial [mine drainage metagenome]
RRSLARIRRAATAVGKEVAIVADLPGPKIRLGTLAAGSVQLAAGERWAIDPDRTPGDAHRVGLESPSFDDLARPGDPVLLGDGSVELEVTAVRPRRIEVRVVNGGLVRSQAGAFFPRARLKAAAFGPADRRAAKVALESGVDYLALSFVKDATDLTTARRWLDRRANGHDVQLIAKIERAEALASIDG